MTDVTWTGLVNGALSLAYDADFAVTSEPAAGVPLHSTFVALRWPWRATVVTWVTEEQRPRMSLSRSKALASLSSVNYAPGLAFGAACMATLALSSQAARIGLHGEHTLVATYSMGVLVVTTLIGWSRPPFERAAAALAMSPLSLVVALEAWAAFGRPIIHVRRLDPHSAFAVPYAVYASALVLAVVLPRISVRTVRAILRLHGARAVATVRALAWMAIVVASALAAAATSRTGRPSPEAYFASLPVSARLLAVETLDGGATRANAEDRHSAPEELAMGALHVRREVLDPRGRCRLALSNGESSTRSDARASSFWDSIWPCDELVFRVDEAHGLVVVESGKLQRVAFDLARPDRTIDVRARRVGATRIPKLFVALSLLGTTGSLGAMIWCRRRLLPSGSDTCRDAISSGDGTLVLQGETAPVAPRLDMPVSPGPVAAVLAPHADSLREPASPRIVRVVPGTVAEVRMAERLMPHALGLVLTTVAAAPLAVALVCSR